MSHRRYHSLQTQFTMRPTHGVSSQFIYTWSKNLGTGGCCPLMLFGLGLGTAFTNPVDRHADYSLQTDTRVHDFRMNGTFNLLIGPEKLLFGKRSRSIARIIKGWQMGWI